MRVPEPEGYSVAMPIPGQPDPAYENQDLGNLAGITGVSWGVFALITEGISDRIGRRRILIPRASPPRCSSPVRNSFGRCGPLRSGR